MYDNTGSLADFFFVTQWRVPNELRVIPKNDICLKI